jgi:hypothetical protein
VVTSQETCTRRTIVLASTLDMMPPVPPLSNDIQKLAKRMEDFEASESVAKTGTGSRREGEGFERLAGELWESVRKHAATRGAACDFVAGVGNRRLAKLSVANRSLFLPVSPRTPVSDPGAQPSRWLEVVFPVSNLIANYPTEAEAVRRYAPESGPFAGPQYPGIFSGLTTKFDDTVVLEEAGVLREKLLLEYKTAKSSAGRQIDGNAHERLSFQIMQYLEVATRYTRCSFAVIANGAFIRYRNKYHVNFHVQADRLANFSWFSMEHACTVAEYSRFLSGLLSWLFEGTARTSGRTR